MVIISFGSTMRGERSLGTSFEDARPSSLLTDTFLARTQIHYLVRAFQRFSHHPIGVSSRKPPIGFRRMTRIPSKFGSTSSSTHTATGMVQGFFTSSWKAREC